MDSELAGNPEDPQPIAIATFYRFVDLPDHEAVARRLRLCAKQRDLLGTVIVAAEGVNATLAGDPTDLQHWIDALRSDSRFLDLRPHISRADRMPFYRLKVKIRDEIVTLGQPGVAPQRRTGVHVDPEQWDELLSDPEVVVIDTRNRYEIGVGTFAGSIDPQTESFRDFPEFVQDKLNPDVNRKVAMFCTGGVRCEKASAWMLEQGFEQIFQLEGGILSYLEKKQNDGGPWRGDCFLFDQRVGVSFGLRRSELDLCHGCRYPLTEADVSSSHYEEGVSCPHCADSLTAARRASLRERHKQETLARQRGGKHIGNRPPGRQRSPSDEETS